MKIEQNKSYHLILPNSRVDRKVHIDYILPSKCYNNEELVVYRYYEQHRRAWVQEIIERYKLEMYNE